MQLKYFLAASAASLSLATAIATPVMAQETTSAIDGVITGQDGAPVAGAKVTVKHIPTGTVSTAVSDGGGHYSLRGLRVGGPYVVTVEGGGYAAETIDGVQLNVGDTFGLPVQLNTKEIVVSAMVSRFGRQLVTGSQSTYNATDIANTVSARRDIRDVMRKDLLASYNANVGGVSIAGGNIRTQRFSVDGIQMQDSFGLNYGGLPSIRGIISMEAIDQLTVKAAPFDISEGNFQGGAVNVVMKSGSNDFHGSVFGNTGGPSLTGKLTRDNRGVVGDVYPVSATKILNFKNYGASLSGPIIKDTLFFSAAYEFLSEGTPNSFGVQGSAAPNPIPNVFYTDTAVPAGTQVPPLTTADAYSPGAFTLPGLNSVFSTFTSKYGSFAIGDVPTAIAEVDRKYSGKLDWNIAPGHRLSLTAIHHENALPNFGSGGSTSTSTPYIALKSDLYGVTEFTNAFSAQLNSAWTDKFSTELRASYKFYRRGQEAYSGPDYAQFNVCLDPTSNALGAAIVASETICSSGSPIVRMGPDTPRQANKFSNKILTIQANATLRAGSHTFKLEYDNMHSSLYNLFVFGTVGLAGTGGPQGLYYFDSFADFGSAKANELVLNSTTTGNKNDGFVRWGYTIHTVGLQDTWHAAPNLTVNAGLRYDFYSADRSIGLNTNFVNRFSNLYPGLTNISTLNGKSKLQPRVGFNWAPTSNLRIAGGFGLFAGGLSDVFISNNYSNTGTSLNSTGAAITGIDLVRINGGCIDRSTGNSTTNGTLSPAICAALDNVNGATPNAAALAYLQNNTGVLANATTNSLDPKFKLPAQWKYNLSLNWKPDFSEMGLGSGWTVRGDVLFSDAQQAIRWIDLRAQPLIIGGVAQTTPDGRIRYGGAINAGTGTIQPGGNSDIQLTNTTAGRARVFAVGLDKEFGFGHVAVGYTHQNVTDVAGALVSSTVGSSYGVPTSSPNSGGDVGRSAFEVRSTYRASLDLHHKFFGDNETRFGVSWALRSGVPFSALMFDSSSNSVSGRAAVFGTINTSSHLLYVPDFSLTAVTNASTTQGTAGTLTQYGNVVFADAATLASVQALVNGTALKNYQGKIAPKNLLTGPSYSKIDLNFAQEFPFFMRSKITALFSIENFLNLLNREWGSYQEIGNTSVIRVACQTAAAGNAQACPAYIYSSYSAPKTTTYPKASLWTIRAGVRLSF